MREHLFRGKRIDNDEWAFGDLLVDDHGYKIAIRDRSTLEVMIVSPETVGEYTGLTDTRGKKIFEGDIMSSNKRKTWIGKGKVWFYNGAFFCGEREWAKFLRLVCLEDKQAVVIGNIHDNPELLED